MADQKLLLTDIQFAYLVGRDSNMYLGGNATHGYMELEGNADPDRIEDALYKVMKRHEALRIVVGEDGTQTFKESFDKYHINRFDLTKMSDDEKNNFIQSYRNENTHKIYECGSFPMFGISAFKMKDDCWRYAFDLDLMVMDRSSTNIFFAELEAFYNGTENELPAMVDKFSDYVIDRSRFKRENEERDRKYWEDYFRVNGIPAAASIPEKGSGTMACRRFVTTEKMIPSDKWLSIKDMLWERHILPSMYLMTCYAKALSIWQNNPHTAINMTTSLRNIDKKIYHSCIGDFTELMIVDFNFGKEGSIFDIAYAAQRKLSKNLKHNAFGGIKVISYLADMLNEDKIGFYPYGFTSAIDDSGSKYRSNIMGENIYQISQTPQIKLDCQVYEGSSGLIVRLDHPEGLYDENMISDLLDYMLSTAGGVSDASVEYTAAQFKYNKTDGYLPKTTIQAEFKTIAEKYPERTAVICKGQRLTYHELDAVSDRFAVFIDLSVGTGKRVMVEAYRSEKTAAAIMGILKTGGSYIPVDPKWPEERKRYIFNHADCSLIIDPLSTHLPEVSAAYNICGAPVDEAYIIFTSGSTGKPKGVSISQRAVCNTLFDINERLSISPEDVFGGISSFCFDLSVYDLFGAFISGAAISISDGVENMTEDIVNNGVTIWNTVPAIMRLFIDKLDTKCSLRSILLSGDWIPLNLKDAIDEKIKEADVYSLGGATEGSIWSIFYPIKKIESNWKSIPYGYPLRNQTMWILGYDDGICPVGVEGEICICGVGVANEYVGDADKTNEHFFVHEKLGRLYRTGDQGVFTSEGYIEFRGRRDFQVKINGYRIELGEIESSINREENIRESIVNVVASQNGAQHIIGYAVSESSDNSEETKKIIETTEGFALNMCEKIPVDFTPEDYRKLNDVLDAAAIKVIRNTLAEFGALKEKDAVISAEMLINKGLISAKYEKLMNQWLTVMCRKGYVYKDEAGNFRCSEVSAPISLDDILNETESGHWHEEIKGFIEFFLLAARNMKQLLIADKSPLEILFHDGSWERAESIYKYNPASQYLNCIAAEAVISYARQKGGKIHILEVGAGVGGTTATLLEELSNNSIDVEYCYTDLSDFFTQKAKKVYEKYRFVEYGRYDLNIHPQLQGYSPKSFDIIIGANCIHDSAYLVNSLGYLRILLKNGGMLLMVEATENLVQYKTTIGLIDGFSGYNDERTAKNEILLSTCEWQEFLQKAGFDKFAAFPPKGHPAEMYDQHVMLALSSEYTVSIDEKQILMKLRESLPSYMIPEMILTLAYLPTTSNGKVDRKALPVPDYSIESMASGYLLPQTGLQRLIVDIFEKELDLDTLSADANIFRTGADSLKSITIVSSLEKHGIKVTLSELYKYPDAVDLEKFILENDRLAAGGKVADQTLIRKRRDKYAPFTLTDLQQSYCYARNYDDTSKESLITGGYVELSADNLDIDKLEKSLNTIFEENEIFRCIFNEDGTGQFLEKIPYYNITVVDKRDLTDNEKEEYIKRTRKRIIAYRPDLKKPPLMYMEVTRLSDSDSLIHIFIDGLILDGWSVELFIAELGSLYLTGKRLYEKSSDYSFVDYIDFMEARRDTEKYKRDKRYWEEKMDDLPEAARLPVLRDISELSSEPGVQNKCGISEECWDVLNSYASEYGVSVFSVLLTAFTYVIGKWNRRRKFLINIPEFNRPPICSQIDTVMGVYSSFLLFTSELDSSVSFIENVRRTQQEILELKEHNSFNGMEIIREINRRSGSHSNDVFVPVVFGMMPDSPQYTANYLEIEKSLFKVRYQENHTSFVWIDINIMRHSGEIDFNWCSVRGLFDQEMINDMIKMQEDILNKAASERQFWERPLHITLPPNDRSIIDAANDTARDFSFIGFGEMMRSSFNKFADRRFLCTGSREYTYRETEELVQHIAGLLKNKGVSRGDKVAVYSPKSLEQVLCILAIVYIGAVYVTIDYSYPISTAIGCMERTECTAAFISESCMNEFKDMQCSLIPVEGIISDSEAYITLEASDTPEDALLCIIHTSGSTGRPKAVEVYQRAVQNCIEYTEDYCGLNSDDCAIALTNVAHDMSIYDMFGMLHAGASVAIINEESVRDPESWVKLINIRNITFWNTVPAMQEMLQEYLKQEKNADISSLKNVILGGDYIKSSLVEMIKGKCPHADVISVGGPTETTLWNIMHIITKEDIENGIIPYGKPISNCKYHILGENLEELPVGVTGMMYCSGMTLAKGYCGDIEETARKFTINPFMGVRMYETGDLGKYNSSGDIIFMGREDNQIKINGKRIELDTINVLAGKTPGIIRCETIVRDNEIILLYSSNDNCTVNDIVVQLERDLPDYMQPKHILRIDTVPLRANGKTDKKKLGEIAEELLSQERNVEEINENDSEMLVRVLNIFSDVLGCSIRPEEDFFKAGGDSITAIRLINRLRSDISETYSIQDFYSDICPLKIAQRLEKQC